MLPMSDCKYAFRKGPNQWPAALPELKPTILEYQERASKYCKVLDAASKFYPYGSM
jgi:isopenicillin N synthase-like dioxygenase